MAVNFLLYMFSCLSSTIYTKLDAITLTSMVNQVGTLVGVVTGVIVATMGVRYAIKTVNRLMVKG